MDYYFPIWLWWLFSGIVSLFFLFKVIGKLVMIHRLRSVVPFVASAEERAVILQKWGDVHILVLVNPFGGNGAGLATYRRAISPSLKSLGLQHTVIFTQHKDHGFSFASQLPHPSPYGAIFCVSGDGLVHEVINGLVHRDHFLTSTLGSSSESYFIPITHIPAGTGNGIAVSLQLSRHPTTALRRVLLSEPLGQPIDLMAIKQSAPKPDGSLKDTVSYSLMSLNYGLVGEGDNIMENHSRWMGWLRDHLIPIWLILRAKTYATKISFVPADEHFDPSSPLYQHDFLQGLSKDPSGERYILEGPTFYLIGSSLTHIAHDIFCTPLARPDDGCMDALFQPSNSRWKALKLFFKAATGLDIAEFKSLGGLYLKMKKLTIHPIIPAVGSNQIVISTDGEILPTLPTKVKMLQGKARFIYQSSCR